MNIYNYLLEGKSLLASTDMGWAFLTTLEHQSLLQLYRSFTPNFSAITVADEGMLQRMVKDVPEQAWDILDLSENKLALVLEETISIPDSILENGFCSFRIIDNCPPLYNVMKRLKQPLWVVTLTTSNGNPISDKHQIPSEYLAKADYIVDLHPLNKKPPSYSVIKIRLNGEIEIVRK